MEEQNQLILGVQNKVRSKNTASLSIEAQIELAELMNLLPTISKQGYFIERGPCLTIALFN